MAKQCRSSNDQMVAPRSVRYFRISSLGFPSGFDIRTSSFAFAFVNEKFVAVRITELSHPTNRCLGFLTVERNTPLFQLLDRVIDVLNLKRHRSSVARRLPSRMATNSDRRRPQFILDPPAFHRRGRGLQLERFLIKFPRAFLI